MNRKYLLTISVAAMILFLGVQAYEILNLWEQKEEQLRLRYKSLSRDAFNMLVSKTRTNGFEKPMAILNIFSGLIETEELPLCKTNEDSLQLKKQAYLKAGSIIKKNELLTSIIKDYIAGTGNDTTFNTVSVIHRYDILNSGSPLETSTVFPRRKESSMLLINSFMEESNTFIIEFDFYIDLKYKKNIILRETIFSLALFLLSIIIVILLVCLTWKNLMKEKRMSELKTDFINNMTHELKTPLSTITVAGRTLEKEQIRTDEVKVMETARLIGKQSVHLNQLINTILEVSLLERTEFEMDRKETDIDDVLHDIINAFLTSCNHCAMIREDYHCSSLSVKIDLLYFTTMINNLLANAIKYCNTDPVIDISSTPEGKSVVITIADNGAGISKDHLNHIFEKFYRVPQGDVHKTKGLGLGLYYVRRIALAHGGEVTVNSKFGKGTTFVITIPQK